MACQLVNLSSQWVVHASLFLNPTQHSEWLTIWPLDWVHKPNLSRPPPSLISIAKTQQRKQHHFYSILLTRSDQAHHNPLYIRDPIQLDSVTPTEIHMTRDVVNPSLLNCRKTQNQHFIPNYTDPTIPGSKESTKFVTWFNATRTADPSDPWNTLQRAQYNYYIDHFLFFLMLYYNNYNTFDWVIFPKAVARGKYSTILHCNTIREIYTLFIQALLRQSSKATLSLTLTRSASNQIRDPNRSSSSSAMDSCSLRGAKDWSEGPAGQPSGRAGWPLRTSTVCWCSGSDFDVCR